MTDLEPNAQSQHMTDCQKKQTFTELYADKRYTASVVCPHSALGLERNNSHLLFDHENAFIVALIRIGCFMSWSSAEVEMRPTKPEIFAKLSRKPNNNRMH